LLDIPDNVLGQLGNWVQHALRAFTPRDQKAVKATAQTMRPKAGLDIEAAITELAVGEALISFLDEKGRPTETERVFVVPPGSQIGPITPEQRQALRDNSLVAGVYEQLLDRDSAYEVLKAKGASLSGAAASAAGVLPTAGGGAGGVAGGAAGGATGSSDGGLMGSMSKLLFGTEGPRGGHRDGIAQLVVKSAVRTVGSSIGREIVRGVLGSLLGGGGRRR
jgi:hypothetical protein